MLIEIYRIFAFLTVFFLALSCWADQSEKHTIHTSELSISSHFDKWENKKFEHNVVRLGLNDLINIGLNNNQTLKVFRQKMVQTQGQFTQARSGYLPHLDAQSRYDYTQRKVSASAETEENSGFSNSVNFSQLIYDFGKTTGAIDVGRLNLAAADADLQRQVQNIIFQVKTAYYNVHNKRRLTDVAAESVNSLNQHLSQAKVFLKAGVRTRIDVINAEVELSKANLSLLRAQYDLKKARVALEQVLGKKPNQGRYELDSDDAQLNQISKTMPPIPDTLENLIKTAMTQRSDIIKLERLTEAAEANVTRVKGGYLPTITAEINYNNNEANLPNYKESTVAGVVFSWNIFSGLQTKGTVVEAQGHLLENKAQLQYQQQVVVKEVTESYIQAEENRKAVQLALQTLGLAKENFLLAEKRYQVGANNLIEFNDAQLNLTKSKGEVVTIYYEYFTALASLELAIGRLSKDD